GEPLIRRAIFGHWQNWPWKTTLWYSTLHSIEYRVRLSARAHPERARAYFRAGYPRQTGHSRCYIQPGSHRRGRPPGQLPEAVPPLQRQSTDQVHDHLRTARLNDVALDTAERFAERLGAQLPDAWWPYSDRDDMLRSATAEERDAASR